MLDLTKHALNAFDLLRRNSHIFGRPPLLNRVAVFFFEAITMLTCLSFQKTDF